MKNAKLIIWGIIIGITSFFAGFFIRQPEINRLKKKLILLEKDNSKLIGMMEELQSDYKDLLVQHKALKALQHRKQKAATKDQMESNLVMQYAIKEYIALLLKRVKHNQEMTNGEIQFFNSFEKVIEGKKISTADMVKIRNHIFEQYSVEIKKLIPCCYDEVLDELDPPKYLFCAVRTEKMLKYYLMDDEDGVQVGDHVYIPTGKDSMIAVEVVGVKKYRAKETPVPLKKAEHIIRKLEQSDFDLPVVVEPEVKRPLLHVWREQAKKLHKEK